MFTKNNDFKNNLIKILLIPLMIVFLLVSTLQTTYAIDLPSSSVSEFVESLDNTLLQDNHYYAYDYANTVYDIEFVNYTKIMTGNTDNNYYVYTYDIELKNASNFSLTGDLFLEQITKYNSKLAYTNYTNNTYTTSPYNNMIYSSITINDNSDNRVGRYFMNIIPSTLLANSSGFLSFYSEYNYYRNYTIPSNSTFNIVFEFVFNFDSNISLSGSDFDFKYINISDNDLLQQYNDFVGIDDIYNEGFNAGYALGYQEGYDTGLTDAISISDYESAFNWGVQVGYNQAVNEHGSYDAGYSDGVSDGLSQGLLEGYNSGYDIGYSAGKSDGFNEGVSENISQSWIIGIFDLFGTVLAIELLPNITIGFLVGLPVILGVVFFVIKVARGGD